MSARKARLMVGARAVAAYRPRPVRGPLTGLRARFAGGPKARAPAARVLPAASRESMPRTAWDVVS